MSDALSVGYRSIDTAQAYFNEEQVGAAIEKSGIARDEIFLTSKVWIEHYGYEECKKSNSFRAVVHGHLGYVHIPKML